MRKEFPDDWSKLHYTQVKANIEYLLKNYKKYGVGCWVATSSNRKVGVWVGGNVKIVFDTKLDSYTINGRLVTSLTGTLYEPLDELFKASKSYYESGKTRRAQETRSRQNIQAWWNERGTLVKLIGGCCVALSVAMYLGAAIDSRDNKINEMVNERKKEYPGYLEGERALKLYEDSLKENISVWPWRNRHEKGN